MSSTRPVFALLGSLALTACAVAPPTGPTVLAVPPSGKDLGQFQQEEANCRNYASAQIGYGSPAQGANQAAVGSAALGTALGAATGALIGSAGAAAGAGAAVGAGAGLLAGSAIGANNAQASGYALQQRYDAAYLQCMTASGNQAQPMLTGGYSPYSYGYSGYSPYYYPYYYPGYYPGYYYTPWFGPTVGLGFFGRFGGPHFHHGFGHGFGHGFHGGGHHH